MIVINLIGIVVVALIVWWFWLYQPAVSHIESEEQVIIVENGSYSPSRLSLNAHEETGLKFERHDPSPCAETVIFPKLELSAELPLNRTTYIALPPLEAGTYEFHCPMKMYRGKVVVS